MLNIDLHCHTVASGHGTKHTLTQLAREAARRGIGHLGISEHGPATPGSCSLSYFSSLRLMPKRRFGVHMLYGAEANILDSQGTLDIPRDLAEDLDYLIASLHTNSFFPPADASRTEARAEEIHLRAYMAAMAHPSVNILGHVDDGFFPVNLEILTLEAAKARVFLEINEMSLRPDSYRRNSQANTRILALWCKKMGHPLLISSDSHGCGRLGETPLALALLRELDIHPDSIANHWPIDRVLQYKSQGL